MKSLYDVFQWAAKAHPMKEAVIADGVAYTYAELARRIDQQCARLADAMPSPSRRRVYVTGVSKLDLIVSVISVFGVGGVAVMAPRADAAIIEDCDPDLILTSEDSVAEIASALCVHHLPPVSQTHDRCGEVFRPPAVGGSDTAMILYTSGTTSGRRKGVMISHQNLIWTTENLNRFMSLRESVREYVASPIEHSFGFARCRSIFYVGGTVVFDEGPFNPARMLTSISRYGCNAIGGVSSIFAITLQRFEKHFSKIAGQIRWVEMGSLPLSATLKRRLLDLMPECGLYMHYGLTEASRTTLLDLRSSVDKIDSVGRPAPGVDVSISDEGEILVRGVNLALGYLNRASVWHEKVSNGWFRTGDLGHIDAEGFLYVHGRTDDVINVGGMKLHPVELEEQIMGYLEQQTFCVVGLPDPGGLLGEVPVLVTEDAMPYSLSELQQFLVEAVPSYMLPRDVVLVEQIPRTESGKIQRSVLRQRVISLCSVEQSAMAPPSQQ